MLTAYSANRQTSLRIWMASSNRVYNTDTSGYSVCARPRFCTMQPPETCTSPCSVIPVADCRLQTAIERFHCGIVPRCSRPGKVSMALPFIHQLAHHFPANSEPLSVFSNCGKRRVRAMVFISAISVERRFWPTQIPIDSRV